MVRGHRTTMPSARMFYFRIFSLSMLSVTLLYFGSHFEALPLALFARREGEGRFEDWGFEAEINIV